MIQNKKSAVIGACWIIISIVVGAFAAHALKKILDLEALSSVETGARYLMYSGLGLVLLSLLNDDTSKLPSNLIAMGSMLFAGSIFLLTYFNHLQIDFPKIIGLITPIGGTLMLAGWGIFLYKLLRK